MARFQHLEAYEKPLHKGYRLLPFRFTPLNENEHVITNQAGEFIVLPKEQVERLVRHALSPWEDVYNDLK